MKIAKIFFISIAAVFVILVVALLVVVASIDPNDYKERLKEIVQRQTGYELSVKGEIKWNLFPALGVDISKISIDSPEGFEGSLVSAERASAALNILPLLQRQLEIGKITLLEPQLTLYTLSDGRSNWQRPSSAEGDTSASSAGLLDQMSVLSAISFAGIAITDATVIWHDERTQEHIEVDEMDLAIGALAPGAPTGFSSRGVIRDRLRELLVYLDVDGTALVSLSPRSVTLEDFSVKAALQGDDDTALNASLTAGATIDLEKDTATLEQLTVRVGDARADADGTIAGLFSSRRTFDTNIKSNVFDLRMLAGELGIELPQTSDDQTFREVSVRGNFAVVFGEKQASVTVRQSDISFDDSRLQIRGDVAWLPALRAQLTGGIDRFDVGRYMSPGNGADLSSPPGFQVSNLRMEAKIEGKKVTIPTLAATVFDGKVQGSASVDMSRAEVPQWYTLGSATNISLEQLLAGFSPDDTPVLQGSGNLSWKLSASGNEEQVLLQSLGGTVELSMKDGRLKNPKLARNIERGIAFLEKRSPQAPGEALILSRADAGFSLIRGVATTRDLDVEMPLLDVKGKGDIDLPGSRVDYHLQVGLASAKHKPADERQYLPIRITGVFDDLEYSLDLKALARQEVEGRIGRKGKKLLEDRKDEVKEIIKDKLAPFFKDIKKLPL